eukprot:765957-Hanusia_phi.AAC.6
MSMVTPLEVSLALITLQTDEQALSYLSKTLPDLRTHLKVVQHGRRGRDKGGCAGEAGEAESDGEEGRVEKGQGEERSGWRKGRSRGEGLSACTGGEASYRAARWEHEGGSIEARACSSQRLQQQLLSDLCPEAGQLQEPVLTSHSDRWEAGAGRQRHNLQHQHRLQGDEGTRTEEVGDELPCCRTV